MKKNTAKMKYEPEDDVLNIWFSRKPIDYAEQTGEVIVHFTKDDEPVYIEILDASKFLKEANSMLPKKIQKQVFPELVQASVAHKISKKPS